MEPEQASKQNHGNVAHTPLQRTSNKSDAVMMGFEQLGGLADFTHVRQDGQRTPGHPAHPSSVPVGDYDAPTLSAEVTQAAAWLQAKA